MRVTDDAWGIDISNESDGYRLTGGGYSVMQVGIDLVVRVTDIILQWKDTRGCRLILILVIRVTDIGSYLYWQ